MLRGETFAPCMPVRPVTPPPRAAPSWLLRLCSCFRISLSQSRAIRDRQRGLCRPPDVPLRRIQVHRGTQCGDESVRFPLSYALHRVLVHGRGRTLSGMWGRPDRAIIPPTNETTEARGRTMADLGGDHSTLDAPAFSPSPCLCCHLLLTLLHLLLYLPAEPAATSLTRFTRCVYAASVACGANCSATCRVRACACCSCWDCCACGKVYRHLLRESY
jgi:hypothetical protein